MSDDAIADLLARYSPEQLEIAADAEECERDLARFYRGCWSVLDPSPYKHNWHIDAICFPADTPIITRSGPRPISEIVDTGWRGDVLSYSHVRKRLEWRSVVAKMKSPSQPLVNLHLSCGSVLTASENHPIFVDGRGYLRADKIVPGQKVLQVRGLRAGIFHLEGKRSGAVLQPLVSLRSSLKDRAREKISTVRALWKNILFGAKSCASALLQHALFRFSESHPRELHLSKVRRREGVGQPWLSNVLRQDPPLAATDSMSSLRQRNSSKPGAMAFIIAQVWGILQPPMLRSICPGAAESLFHSWPQPRRLSEFLPKSAQAGFGPRWQQVLSLLRTGAHGHSSHRPQQTQQRDVESRNAVSYVPSPSERIGAAEFREAPSDDYEIVESTVSSIEREVRIPAALYNIEVEENHNYFASDTLVHNCDHLMAVTDGQIKKLLINVPFRTGKTLLVSVAWHAWTWAQKKKGPRSGPQVSFLTLSYASKLSLDNALTANRLIKSEWYQKRWGARFQIAKDKDSNERFDSDKGGSRISAGFDGSTLGRGGAIKLIDDPHKIQEVESDIVRESILKTYDEALSSRFTDPVESAEVTIMQRIGENDLSGHILEKGNVCHLMIPMEYDPARHCVTYKDDGEPFWQDPRGADPETGEQYCCLDDEGRVVPGTELAEHEGECMWPERFPPDTLEALKESLGPFSVAGQLQQSPAPRGGGIIRRDWWRPYRSKTFPNFGTVVASLDTALKEKESNDYNALTIWGAFPDDGNHLNIMLKDAWRGRCSINELVETVAKYCRKHQVDVLLIEDKTRGHDTAAELRRMYGGAAWSTRLLGVKGDKVSRTNAVAGLWSGTLRKDAKSGIETWSGGIIWAPTAEGVEYDWVDPVLSEFESFPTGKHDDFVDSGTMAVQWMRTNGVALYRTEFDEEEGLKKQFRKSVGAIYDV